MCNDNPNFVHLHLHTQYSLLDGFAHIDRVVNYAVELGMPALAISDHGTMFGVIDFYRACKKAHLQPIIGVEAYLARRTRFDRDSQLDAKPYHMLLLARNRTGYQNLLKLTSAAQLEGYYYRPRIDHELMAAHAQGLIATSGCLAAEIPRMVAAGNEQKARELIGWYQDIFGKDHFYLELQGHNIPELNQLNRWLVENASYANVPLVVTNDVHYVRAEDYDPHDTLLCIQTSTLKNDTNRMSMSGGNSYYLKTQAEMWALFGEVPQALMNTLKIAEMIEDVNLDDKQYHLPIFPVPYGFEDARHFLRHLCQKGVAWRYGSYADSATVQNRLDHELRTINRMGFDTYFLIVWDLCEFARSKDIWWNVRGSGAGSIVAYSLGITNLDPLDNGLLFERFLNPGRVSMPDFDLDFPEDRRAEMIEYCTRKYGEDKVAAIITFGTLGAKQAIRDVGRALDMPLTEVDRIARLVPTVAKPPKIYQLLGEDDDKPEFANQEFIEIYEQDEYARRVIDTARVIEGVPRHASTHAAGIIVADRPLVEYLPLHRPTKGGDDDNNPVKMVTQFPMETAESIGLLKIDFLGLSTLTIMRKACELIKRYHGIHYDMSNIPIKSDPNDPEITRRVEEVFKMLGRGETVGVFQLESSGMRQMLKGMRPKNFENIIAAISLYRPGPMQFIPQFNRRLHGEEAVEYLHPKLEPIIGNTFGIITYQEQIMQIAAELFGYDLGEADLMRRAVSKKKAKDLQEHRGIFMERGPENEVDAETAGAIFDQIEFFANYGFNKSHAADYAVITCQTAYLKCHYPHEYMTALMSVYYDVAAKVSLFAADCYRMGIDILPPNVNHSYADFIIEQYANNTRHIRFGMGAIKNVGVAAIDHITQERDQDGKFADLDDFLARCDMRVVGKRALESLIRVGALDDFGDRPVLLHNLERMMSHSIERRKAADVGQISMFDFFDSTEVGQPNAGSVWSMIETPPTIASKREQLRWEKELLGFYITDHPLKELSKTFENIGCLSSEEVLHNEGLIGRTVRVAGLVNDIRTITTKKGEPMAIVTLEDLQGLLPCVMFPKTWGIYRSKVQEDNVIFVDGKVDSRNDEIQIIVDKVSQNATEVRAVEVASNSDAYASLMMGPFNNYIDSQMDEDDNSYYPPHDELPEEPSYFPDEEEWQPSVAVHNGNGHPPAAIPTEPLADAEPAMLDKMDSPVGIPEILETLIEVEPLPVAQRLHVVLHRTGDDSRDTRQLEMIYNTVSQFPGDDALWVDVYVDGEYEATICYENFTGVCQELIDKLANDVKVNGERVWVETL